MLPIPRIVILRVCIYFSLQNLQLEGGQKYIFLPDDPSYATVCACRTGSDFIRS